FISRPLVARPSSQKKDIKPVVLPKKYIFCPFQVALDSQVLVYSPWIMNMHNFYELISKVSESLDEKDLFFVIKEHPSCKMDYSDLKSQNNERIIFANANSTQELIENAEMIITLNSTVGIESLIYNKKVITLGQAFYSGFGLAKNANSAEE